MARKSRRASAQQQTSETVASAQPQTCRFAVYARTSHDYGDDGTSIGNQVAIVREHLAKLPGAAIVEVYEDSGRSGTNQDREEFQRMLADARSGRVQGIAAKDASRLGRDYVECQSLITRTLPALGVRLVLVGDGIDTGTGDARELFLHMKSIMNDLYSRDLSRKVHASFDAARKRGPLILGTIPYGYARDPEDRHHLVPDPETAPYVSALFTMKLDGASNAEIADWLQAAGAPTPGKAKYERAGMEAKSKDSRRWNARTVNRLLSDPVYKGTLVMGKWAQSLYEGSGHRKTPASERIVVEGAHEPLVAPEDFDRLAAEREERARKRHEAHAATERARSAQPDRLKGKVLCAECEVPMAIVRWTERGVFWGAEYCCGNRDRDRHGGRHRIAVPLLETLAMDAIRERIATIATAEQDAPSETEATAPTAGLSFSAALAAAAIERIEVRPDGSVDVLLRDADPLAWLEAASTEGGDAA